MAVRDTLFRLTRIIKKLKRGPSTLIDIQAYVERECEINDFQISISSRTFSRDKELILSLFNIEINYCNKSGLYSIDPDDFISMPKEESPAFLYLI